MRVALISDLHANLVALEAVLADAARSAVDRIVCLGDVATLGPRPKETLARLRDLGCDCVLGNHDEFLLDAALIRAYTEAAIIVESVEWCRAQLAADDLAFIRSFHRTMELPLEGEAKIFVFHGTPRSHTEDLLAQTPADTVDEMLAGRHATVMAGGHTHIQMLRQHRGILLVNPGSVGMPFREHVTGRAPTILPHAEYAVVESQAGTLAVSLRRVEIDLAKLRDALRGLELPLAPLLLQQYS
jgi:putative phosphoesterase